MKKVFYVGCILSLSILFSATALASSHKVIPGITPEFQDNVTVTQESRPMTLKYFKGRHWRLMEERIWVGKDDQKHMDRVWEDAKGRYYVERIF